MEKLILAKLSEEQVTRAREANGKRKKITHVLMCGKYGNIFNTEKHCRKYFNAWRDIFKGLFDETVELKKIDLIDDYHSAFDIVSFLIRDQDDCDGKN